MIMTTIQLTEEQMKGIGENLNLIATLLETKPTSTEKALIEAYVDLATALKNSIVPDGTMLMVGREEFIHDNMDRPERHNIAGSMNRPSQMQEEAYKEEHKDDHD